MGIPLCIIYCFSFAAFNICSLFLIFIYLINMCLQVFQLGFILFGTLWVSWTWVAISFPILGKFSAVISSSILSSPFFLSSSSGTPMIQMLVCLTCSSGLWGCSFYYFFFFPLCFIYFHHSVFHHTLSSLLLQLFYCYYCIIHYWLTISSRSLLNISCIFSILLSSLFICNSILFSRFWIIFTINFLNYFSGRLLISSSFVWFGVFFFRVPSPAEYFSAFSFCLHCCVWGALSVDWKFVFPLYCGSSSLWVWLD